MKNWKRLLALLLAGAMTLSLCACNTGDDPNSTGSAEPSAQASAYLDADPSAEPEIVADLSMGALEFSAGISSTDTLLTVNGVALPADLVLYILTMNCINMQSYLPYFGMTLADVADSLLEESVSVAAYHALMRQKAGELGCLPTDAQKADIAQTMEEADLETNAPYYGLTDSSAEYIFSMNAYYNNVLEAATHEPSAEELDQFLADQGVFSVKHILIKTTDDSNQALAEDVVAAKKTQADDLLSQLQAAEDMPAKFDELMNEFSEDGRDETGALYAPDGYTFSNDDSLVGGFREAALELEEGQLSGIVETAYGYHIMLRLPVSEEDRATYAEDYRPIVLDDLANQWLEDADIVRADALSDLDVSDYFSRLTAYWDALSAQAEGEG